MENNNLKDALQNMSSNDIMKFYLNEDGTIKSSYVFSNDCKLNIQIDQVSASQLLSFQQYFNSCKTNNSPDSAVQTMMADISKTHEQIKNFAQGVVSFNDMAITSNSINDIDYIRSFEEIINTISAVVFMYIRLPKKKK
jgi:hypothetical protein